MTTASEAAIASTGAKPADLSQGQGEGGAPIAPPEPSAHAPVKTAAQLAEEKGKLAEADAAALKAAKAKTDNEGPGVQTPEEIAAAKAAKEAADANRDWQDGYVTFDDPSAQAAVDLLKESNVSVIEANAIFSKAVKSGNLADVDWPTLEKKVGATKALLIRNGVEKYHNDVLSVHTQIVNDTYLQLGNDNVETGKQNWETIKAWAHAQEKADTTGAFKTKIDSYRKMIDLGGESRRLAIVQLKSLYDTDPKTKGLGTSNIAEGTKSPSFAEGTPLTRHSYMEEMRKANATKQPKHVFDQLRARRTAGLSAGI